MSKESMLKKIILKNVASYKEKPVSLEFEKKVILFYGNNGAGKSTITNLLTSPDDSSFSQCQISKEEHNSIHVYNQKYISENFVSQDNLPGIFTLSKDNGDILSKVKDKEKAISEKEAEKKKIISEKEVLDNEFSQKKQKVLNSTWKIKESYSGGDRVLEFCLKGKMGSKNDLFEHLMTIPLPKECTITIEDLKKEANEILGEGQKIDPLSKVEITGFTSESEQLLKKSIVGNKESSVSGLIEKLANEDWVRKGLDYVHSDNLSGNAKEKCPFCQEDSVSKSLIDSIKSYFNEAYENDVISLREILKTSQNKVSSLPDEKVIIDHKKVGSRKDELLLRLRELRELLESNSRKIEEKVTSPGIIVELRSFREKLDEVNCIIGEVNSLVDEHNGKIDRTADVSEDIRKNFWSLMRFNYNTELGSFESDRKMYLENYSKRETSIIGLASDSEKLRNEIIGLQKMTVNIDEAVSKINNHLKDMGISHFELVKHGDTGAYKIQREGKSVDIYRSLSEGEKTIITFLYFLEQCKGLKNPSEVSTKKIIVIDDPISSLSHMYVFNIGRLIKTELFDSEDFEQVLVLTHSLYFFHELLKPKRQGQEDVNQELFRVFKTDDGSQISRMSPSEIRNEYQSYWSVLKDNSTPVVLLANCMRNILEHFFGFVQSHESINNIFQQLSLRENKFQAFLRYMDRGSHSNVTNISDYKELNHEHFKEAFRLVFETNGHGEHYKKMMKV